MRRVGHSGGRTWAALEQRVRCRARSSGGINTQSHSRFLSNLEQFTDGKRAQRLLFNFWESKVALSIYLLFHLFSDLAVLCATHPSLFHNISFLSLSCSFPGSPLCCAFSTCSCSPLQLFILSSFQTGVRSTYCCSHIQLIRRWSQGKQPS